MEEKDKIYIGLDSDVLRALSELDACLGNDPNYDYKTSLDFMVRENGQFFKEFLQKIKNDEVRIFVGNTVFHEVKHRDATLEFIQKYAYFTRINSLNFDEINKDIDELAYAYCQDKFHHKKKEYYPPLNMRYDPSQRKYVPSNDAYAVAESSYVGCCFLTGNGQDIVFKKNSEDNDIRAIGISIINYNHDYTVKGDDGKYLSPRTYNLSHFIYIINKYGWENFIYPDVSEEKFDKVSDLMA